MGLDMYLTATHYCGGGWDHAKAEERQTFQRILEAVGLDRSKAENSATVSVGIGYWRKANAIHQWFVKEVQDGEDKCRPFPVEREKLMELKGLCERVLASCQLVAGNVSAGTRYEPGKKAVRMYAAGEIVADPSAAIDLLPTGSGFFFGCTDYDEGYIADLRLTVEIVERCLSLPECWEFEYRSSW
jgi:hypothetical protein